VQRDSAEYRVQSSDADEDQRVCWYCETVMRGFGGFQNDVASHLMYAAALPAPAEDVSQLLAGDAARKLHATDMISSRTK
jgi:hypothetical protein